MPLLPGGGKHPLKAEQIKAGVKLGPGFIQLDALEAGLYGGMLSGALVINRVELVGRLVAKNIALQSLVQTFTDELVFTGSMEAAAKFKMRLDKPGQFSDSLQLNGDFYLRKGLLSKVDLLQATKGKSVTNGSTRFDDLTGLLAVDASGYHFSQLKIVSGSLNAEGKIDINPTFQLSGMLETEVKGTAGLASIPIVVSGTVQEPVVRPAGSAMAGAAVGTMILGPGLGTAAGIRIGGFLQRMFGKDDHKSASREAIPKPSPGK